MSNEFKPLRTEAIIDKEIGRNNMRSERIQRQIDFFQDRKNRINASTVLLIAEKEKVKEKGK